MIHIQSLYKSYGSTKVLDDINVSFSAGEVYGIVGKNGSGKTTLLKCIAGLEEYQGAISYSGATLKNTTGFLPTEPHLISKITGLEYLTLLTQARGLPDFDPEHWNVFDLPLKKYAETYSTGMKKKLALTGILLQRNEVIILDEPFNGVDLLSNILIKELIMRLKELGKIVLLTSHILSIVEEICDKMHYLEKGVLGSEIFPEHFGTIETEMKKTGDIYNIGQLDL